MAPEQGPQDQIPQQEGPQYGAPQPQPQPRPPERRDEKQDEKQGEKEREKKQEKGGGLDEKYHRNPLGFVSFALIIIWLGVSLLLMNADVITDTSEGWAIFVWGGGVIILAEALLRLAIPRFRRPVVGSFVWGAIWIGVGFGLWYGNWEVIGPIVIIAIGVAILVGRLVPRR
jgi:hypothetical protein